MLYGGIMDKKKLLLNIIFIVSLVVLFFLSYLLFNSYILKTNFANDVLKFANKNENIIFKVDKITMFSNCDAKNKTSSISNFTIENLFQFTDIAIFLNSSSNELTMENTIKNVNISNIKFITLPDLGIPNLYFKGLNQFAKSEYDENNKNTVRGLFRNLIPVLYYISAMFS